MYKIFQIIIGSNCQVLKMTIDEGGRCSVCVIIHESNFKSVACFYI